MSANDEIQFHIAAMFVLDLDYGPAGDQNSKPDMTQKGYPRLFSLAHTISGKIVIG